MNVFIKKEKLSAILVKNRQRHIEIYKETKANFKKKYIEKLNQFLKQARKDKFTVQIPLSVPECYKTSYDVAFKMVNLSSRDEIELNEEQFKNFVLDKWHWTYSFVGCVTSNSISSSTSSTTSSYLSEMEEEDE